MEMKALSNGVIKLRAVEPSDGLLMAQWENDPSVWGVSNRTTPYSEDFLKKYTDSTGADFWEMGQMRFIVEELSSGKAVGAVDFFDAQALHQRAGVGIFVEKSSRGKGLAVEALQLAHQWAFDHALLHQVCAEVHADNAPCLAVFKKVGYKEAGLWRQWHRTRKGFKDVVLFQFFADNEDSSL